ncbi:aldo/keto reductase [Phyllobacterium sp. LjRoot231]
MSLEPIGESRIGFASRLGFGASGIGTLYRDVPEAQAQEVLRSAYDAGLRYFDTAPLYGHGLSELRLGQFLRTLPRETVTVSTKAGRYLVPPRGDGVDYGPWAAPLRLKPVFDYSYDGTMRSLDQSAIRLGFSEFDLVYIHDVDRFTHGDRFEQCFNEAIEGCYRALDDLRKAGHIRAVGVGVNESDVATRLLQNADLDAVMIAGRYTLLDQSAADDLLPLAASKASKSLSLACSTLEYWLRDQLVQTSPMTTRNRPLPFWKKPSASLHFVRNTTYHCRLPRFSFRSVIRLFQLPPLA